MGARLHGPSQGVYQCHMRHMVVKKPMNINDEDLVEGMSHLEQALSQPTSMSFQLQRLRLAGISRTIVDRIPLVMAHLGSSSHDIVMDIDTEMQSLINDVPPFFSMSVADLIETYQLTPARAGDIFHQGHIFYSLAHSQRCKLHFPYLSYGCMDPAFGLSRQICLQSARVIIETEKHLEASGFSMAERYKFIGLFCAVYEASIVLFVDLCHKSSSQQEKQRGEIADAFQIIEEARHESEKAAKFLDSLAYMLRKHKISPLAARPGFHRQRPSKISEEAVVDSAVARELHTDSVVKPAPMVASSVLESNDTALVDMSGDEFTNREDIPTYFDELTQSFEQGLDFSSFDWNSLYSGFDPSFI